MFDKSIFTSTPVQFFVSCSFNLLQLRVIIKYSIRNSFWVQFKINSNFIKFHCGVWFVSRWTKCIHLGDSYRYKYLHFTVITVNLLVISVNLESKSTFWNLFLTFYSVMTKEKHSCSSTEIIEHSHNRT